MLMQYTLKKSLGQHFLQDENVCRKMVNTIQQNLAENNISNLLEVGAGGGALTKQLALIDKINFKAVEIDEEKINVLLQSIPSLQNRLIHQSILEMNVPFESPFLIAGNFPYNISSQILFKVLEWKDLIPVMIGMFQKEVAQRIAAQPGTKVYGILSVLIQAFYTPEYLFDVSPGSFKPPPKVMSGVLRLNKKKEITNMKSEPAFFTLVKIAFNQRRKMLRNAVKSLFDESSLKKDIFDKRAEQLSVADFARLTFEMK